MTAENFRTFIEKLKLLLREISDFQLIDYSINFLLNVLWRVIWFLWSKKTKKKIQNF